MANRKPNIILIMTDQQRGDAVGWANPEVKTPNLDQLAEGGAVFERAYVQNPVCMPSRASALTGRYPLSHGLRANGVCLPENESILPQVLQANGYTTALFGKLHLDLDYFREDFRFHDGQRYGFDITRRAHDSRRPSAYRAWLSQHYPNYHTTDEADLIVEGDHTHGYFTRAVPEGAHFSEWVAEETVQFIRNHAQASSQKPFFISASFYDPHPPFDPPQRWARDYDPRALSSPWRQAGELENKPVFQHEVADKFSWVDDAIARHIKAYYYAMISGIDHAVGRILHCLEEENLAEDTIVVFMSDHGELLGDHGLLYKGPYLYESLLRVPLAIRWPGHIAAGQRVASIVQEVDLMPTLLKMTEIETPPGNQGRSLLPLMTGRGGDTSRFDWSITTYRNSSWSWMHFNLDLSVLVTPRWKLIHYHDHDCGELYDLQNDPHEFHNLWDDAGYQSRKHELQIYLFDLLVHTEDPLPPIEKGSLRPRERWARAGQLPT